MFGFQFNNLRGSRSTCILLTCPYKPLQLRRLDALQYSLDFIVQALSCSPNLIGICAPAAPPIMQYSPDSIVSSNDVTSQSLFAFICSLSSLDLALSIVVVVVVIIITMSYLAPTAD